MIGQEGSQTDQADDAQDYWISQKKACCSFPTILNHWLGVVFGNCGLHAKMVVGLEADAVAEAIYTAGDMHSEYSTFNCHSG